MSSNKKTKLNSGISSTDHGLKDVHVVSHGDQILAIFSTEEKCDEFIKYCGKFCRMSYSYNHLTKSAHSVDKHCPSSSNTGKILYDVLSDESGIEVCGRTHFERPTDCVLLNTVQHLEKSFKIVLFAKDWSDALSNVKQILSLAGIRPDHFEQMKEERSRKEEDDSSKSDEDSESSDE